MKVYILGPTGMLGHVLCKTLESRYDVVPIPSSKYDFRNKSDIEYFCSRFNGDEVVINCCGILRQRLPKEPSPQDMTDAFMVNSILPFSLSNKCKLIHISTDCVFSGKNRAGKYIETDIPDAEDIYGRTKLIGEPKNAMVLRTSIIGKETHRYLGLYSWFQNTSNAYGFTNHLWNGLTTNQLSKSILNILQNGWKNGLYHLFSNTMSKYELLCEFNKYRSNPAIVTPSEGQCPIDRTLSSINMGFVEMCKITDICSQIKEMEK